MNEFLSLIIGTVYGIVVFIVVVHWMKRKKLTHDRNASAQRNLFDAARTEKASERDKRSEVAMAATNR